MTLTKLEINRLRNISQAKLALSPGFNLIYGANGSGKTSILDAAYILSTARSFRNDKATHLIKRGEEDYLVRGEVSCRGTRCRVGVQRDRQDRREIRIDGEAVTRGSDLVRLLPVLALGPGSSALLTGPPANRRRFLNWGVFHVEHQFGRLWEEANRSLAQRNRLLTVDHLRPTAELDVWTAQLVEHAERVDEARVAYLQGYEPVFRRMAREVAGFPDVSLVYRRGWDPASRLSDVYANQLPSDMKKGYTQQGFQRADLRIEVCGQPADKVCSGGELKAIVWAMLLAQGRLTKRNDHQATLYLLDDLAAEFDSGHRGQVCRYLLASGEQVLLTGMEKDVLDMACEGRFGARFHVEHGAVFQEV